MFKARNPIDEVQVKQLSPKYYHRSNVSSEKDSQLRDINVPEDGNCLFWSIAMAYLIPVGNDDVLFQQRYKIYLEMKK